MAVPNGSDLVMRIVSATRKTSSIDHEPTRSAHVSQSTIRFERRAQSSAQSERMKYFSVGIISENTNAMPPRKASSSQIAVILSHNEYRSSSVINQIGGPSNGPSFSPGTM